MTIYCASKAAGKQESSFPQEEKLSISNKATYTLALWSTIPQPVKYLQQ